MPNINLSPVRTCHGMPCLNTGCYAMKAYRQYPVVKKSWEHNTRFYFRNPEKFFKDIIESLRRMKPKTKRYFRWHSAGEIPDQRYVDGMIRVALAFPKTRFLCFTKRYHLDFSGCPKNLCVVFSTWPGMVLPRKTQGFPIAWMHDGSDTEARRIAKHAKSHEECKMDCRKCKLCWFLKQRGEDVVFHKH